MTTYSDKFSAEGTYTLIVRLRHNVIKTGVRMINLSYSRISLADIADKLQLGSPEDAEFIIAKVTFVGENHFSQCLQTTNKHPFNGPLSGTTRVSRYRKGKTNLDFAEARDSEWLWHQLGRMPVCTSL